MSAFKYALHSLQILIRVPTLFTSSALQNFKTRDISLIIYIHPPVTAGKVVKF